MPLAIYSWGILKSAHLKCEGWANTFYHSCWFAEFRFSLAGQRLCYSWRVLFSLYSTFMAITYPRKKELMAGPVNLKVGTMSFENGIRIYFGTDKNINSTKQKEAVSKVNSNPGEQDI